MSFPNPACPGQLKMRSPWYNWTTNSLVALIDFLKIRPRSEYHVEATREGLRCSGSREGVFTINWGNILEIEGFKRDRVTTDLICLAIRYYEGGGKTVEINEDMEDFDDAVTGLERQEFLGSNWQKFVTLPPFQARRVVLFTASKTY
jgi:hypothetical protein